MISSARVGNVFSLLTFGSVTGAFGLDLPARPAGVWDPRYNDPLGTFSLWVI